MLRSMYSGISGMKVNQTKLDVIGNNVANVGTTSFKGSRVRFQDMLSQNVKYGSGSMRNTGGVNPSQVGLGAQIAGIDRIVTQGNMQPTGRNLDVAMDGAGYFMIATGPVPDSNFKGMQVNNSSYKVSGGNGMSVSYTRDGSFALDTKGYLVTSDGLRVLGYPVTSLDKDGNQDGLSIDYSKGGLCQFVDADNEYGVKAQNNLVPMRIPENIYVNASELNEKSMNGVGMTNDITKTPKITLNEGKPYDGEQDLSVEVRMIQKDTSYKVVNEDGTLQEDPTDIEAGSWAVYVNGELVGPVGGDVNYVLEKPTTDEDGNVVPGKVVKVNVDGGDLPTATDDEIKKYKDTVFTQSVYSEGDRKIRTFNIEKDGTIKGILEDGKVAILGQLAVASFQNPEGLTSIGKNGFITSPNSGSPIIRSGLGADPAYDNSDGYGDVMNGMLEMSNVDLAEQFTDMIVATRAFQANSKIISTGDEILQELINLKR